MKRIENVIAGQSVTAHSYLPFRDPRTGEVTGEAPDSDAATVDRAVRAAREAFATWRRSTPADRQRVLLRLADLVEEHQEELLDAEIACTGKPREATRAIEVLRAADQLRFFAGAARVVQGTAQTEYLEGYTSSVRREPLGVVAQITPWNYPLMMATWKIGAALATGNTLVIKPAETTPWSTVLLVELASELLPAGVVNVVCGGRETGAALVEHPDPDLVAITGSTRAGREVMRSAAGTLKDVHLELGGKAPAIVFDDVDVDAVATALAAGGYFNAGQDCTAVTRVLVHESVHDALAAAIAEAARAVRLGEPEGPDDDALAVGPLNSQAQLDKVSGMVADLPAHAKVLAGGRATGQGYYFEPTVVTGVRQDDAIVREEVFGPVLTVQPFADEDEAVALANDCVYGLAGSVWTRDGARAHRVINALDFGELWVNCHQVCPAEAPHGGFKQSGNGKDLSVFALDSYTRIKSVTTALEP